MVWLDRTIGLPTLALTGVALPMVRSSRTMTGSPTVPFNDAAPSAILVMVRLDRTIVLPTLALTDVATPMVRRAGP